MFIYIYIYVCVLRFPITFFYYDLFQRIHVEFSLGKTHYSGHCYSQVMGEDRPNCVCAMGMGTTMRFMSIQIHRAYCHILRENILGRIIRMQHGSTKNTVSHISRIDW